MIDEDAVAQEILCGADPEEHLKKLAAYAEAGYTHVWVHQVGAEQEGFFQFYEQEVLPQLAQRAASTKKTSAKAARR
jgi:hypothetical protein